MQDSKNEKADEFKIKHDKKASQINSEEKKFMTIKDYAIKGFKLRSIGAGGYCQQQVQ